MAYGKPIFQEMKRVPDALREIGIRPVFVPRQDGYREHYAFIDDSGAEIYVCSHLDQLVTEGDKRIRNSQ